MQKSSDFKKLLISITSRYLYQFVSIFLLLLLTPLMIHKLGDYYYGLWILATVIISYFELSEVGITGAVERYLALHVDDKDKEKYNLIFVNGLFLNIILSIFIIIISLISLSILPLFLSDKFLVVKNLIVILAVSLAVNIPFKTFSAIMYSHLRFEVISCIMSLEIILRSGLIVWFLYNGYGISELPYSYLISWIISAFLYIYWGFKTAESLSLNPKLINMATIKDLSSYTGKYFLNQIADILKTRLDEIITASFISVNMVTIYSVASRLNNNSARLYIPFLRVIKTFFSKNINTKTDNEKLELFFLSSKLMIVLAFFVLFWFLYFGNPFITLWLGGEYSQAYYILIILGLMYFLGYSTNIGGQYLFAINKHQYNAYIGFIEGIAGFLLCLLFILHFKLGLVGIALARLIICFISKIFIFPYIVTRYLTITPVKYVMFYGKNYLAGFILFFLSGLPLKLVTINSYTDIILGTLYLSLILIIYILIILNKKEKNIFLSKIKRKKIKKDEVSFS